MKPEPIYINTAGEVITLAQALAQSLPTRRGLQKSHPEFVAVVGESHYQETLRRMLDQAKRPVVTIEAEPTNQYDKNAVRIANEAGETIGYIAKGHYTALKAIAQKQPIKVWADLRGGTPDKPSIGIVLDLREVFPNLGQDEDDDRDGAYPNDDE